MNAKGVKWVVNDMAELGVEIDGRVFFLYMGCSLEYEGHHDGGRPIMYRPVGKREFGETCKPETIVREGIIPKEYTIELTYIDGLNIGNPRDFDWKPLPKGMVYQT